MSTIRLPKSISLGGTRSHNRGRYQVLRTVFIVLAITLVAFSILNQRTIAAPPAQQGTALAELADLTVKDQGSSDGYSRERFGPAWMDVDHNSCDTRNDILARDLSGVKYTTRKETCRINQGTLQDPYTGKNIKFRRGVETSAAVQIDHIVPLLDAWRKGAKSWDMAKREEFANDPLNLMAADGPANQAKGAKDAAHWLPENTAFQCQYVARQIAVKNKYGLWITQTEATAMQDLLATCPNEPLPAG